MYTYINGTITEILPEGITIENNQIGFFIKCANPYRFKIGEQKKIYTYQLVREDEISLFGFLNKAELALFLKLINVKGLGCRMVMPMLAVSEPKAIIDAIEAGDIQFLTKFPKIGEKLARQIVLDLRGKLVEKQPIQNSDLVETLKALGYKKSNIDQVLSKINNNLPIEKQIKEALKLL